jgi:hypothetical protein
MGRRQQGRSFGIRGEFKLYLGIPTLSTNLCESIGLTDRYFPVTEEESTSTRVSHQVEAFDKAILVFKHKEQESPNSTHAGIGDDKLSVRTPWLGATKWLERFVGANMNMLAELADRTKKRGDYLTMVEKEVGDLMEDSREFSMDRPRARSGFKLWHHVTKTQSWAYPAQLKAGRAQLNSIG